MTRYASLTLNMLRLGSTYTHRSNHRSSFVWICFNMRKVPCSSRAVLKLFRKMFFALGKKSFKLTTLRYKHKHPGREALSSTTQCPYSAALSRAKNMPQSLLAVRNFDLGTMEARARLPKLFRTKKTITSHPQGFLSQLAREKMCTESHFERPL